MPIRPQSRRVAAATSLALALLVAGCGSEDESSDSPAADADVASSGDAAHLVLSGEPEGVQRLAIYDSRPVIEQPYHLTDDALIRALDDQAGSVLVISDDDTENNRRILVCASPHTAASDVVDYDQGPRASTGDVVSKVSTSGPSCGVSGVPAVLWSDGDWVLRSVALDGNAERAAEVVTSIALGADDEFVVGELPGELRVIGQLDPGWQVPPDHAFHNLAYDPGDGPRWNENLGLFGARVVTVSPDQRVAITARLSESPMELASWASTPVYTTDWGAPSNHVEGGRELRVGAWDVTTVVAVEIPEDPAASSVAMIAGGLTGGSGAYLVPPPALVARLAATAEWRDEDATQRAIDEARAATYQTLIERRAADMSYASYSTTDDDLGRLWMQASLEAHYPEDDASEEPNELGAPMRSVALRAGRVFAPSGRSPSDDLFLLPRSTPVSAAAWPVPSSRPMTFSDPVDLLPTPDAGRFEVFVLAEPDIEVTVSSNGESPLPVSMTPINSTTEISERDLEGVEHPYTGGERWGRIVVTSPGGRDAITVTGTSDGEVVFEGPARDTADYGY